jgi:hypothetical protein
MEIEYYNNRKAIYAELKKLRLTYSHTRLGLNPQIGRPVSRIVVNHTRVCRNATHACRNNTLRVEITLVGMYVCMLFIQ